MGYTTDFYGEFRLNKPLDHELKQYLVKFNEVRHMARNLSGFGVEGEFYVEGGEHDTILDYNRPPATQPGLWCGWRPNRSGTAIIWDGAEKFYSYTEWLEYIIALFLKPQGYVLNGTMRFQGEERCDHGTIVVSDNKVIVRRGF